MAHLSDERVQQLYAEFGDLEVLDDVIRHRAADDPPVPILGYPRFEQSVDDYELFTGETLDRYINGALRCFISSGFEPNGRRTVALLAPSNLDLIVSLFALSRLGYTIFPLSLRINPTAIVNLLQKTDCKTIVHGHLPTILSTLQQVNRDFPVSKVEVPRRNDYDRQQTEPCFTRDCQRRKENEQIALIIHSSGSTGLPKPIFLTHRALLTHPTQGSGLHNFNALPWYHLYGISTSLQAMWMRKTAYLYNTNLPLTARNLLAVVEKIRPEAVQVVPYVLGLIAETPKGVEILKSCRLVTAAGARTPDELGDRLVKESVNLGVVFGTTECGLAGDTMRREKGDDSWNYIRVYANIRQYLHMSPVGDDLYEFVYLKGHPALSTSNSDDPLPGSWHSKDVFTPHPSISDVWKYVTRVDDRVTLVNGEKVLPLPIEGRMREDPLIREAVVVGIDQSIPGLLVFRAEGADEMPDDTYLNKIWSSVVEANSHAEAFSQITREMIKLLPSDIAYPQTDKGSIIRAQVYTRFEKQIKELYARPDQLEEGDLRLDLLASEDWIMTAFRDVVGICLGTAGADFFSSGVDSLKAIQMRRLIQKSFDLRGSKLSPNIVYEKGNAQELAQYLSALSNGIEIKDVDQALLARSLTDKYSRFARHEYRDGLNYGRRWGQAAFLTGATGAIGAHIVAQLVAKDEFDKVYCLVRGANPLQRVFQSLSERQIEVPEAFQGKIIAFSGDLVSPNFGLDPSSMALMKREVSLMIHSAWPVNFNIPLRSFESQIAGLHNLLQFSLSVKRSQPAQLFFCSSISVALKTLPPAFVLDSSAEDFSCVSPTGYAQSKFVGEHVVRNAARAGARSYVLRIGQVVGDTANGIWNDKDFIPMMIRSAITLKTLPILRELCSWLPVDTLATVILELSETLAEFAAVGDDKGGLNAVFYNVVHPHTFSWEDLLGELRICGLNFVSKPFNDWLQMLRESAAQEDEAQNPAVKLLGYFENTYGAEEGFEGEGIRFETTAARRDSSALRAAPKVVESGLVRKFLDQWLERWGR